MQEAVCIDTQYSLKILPTTRSNLTISRLDAVLCVPQVVAARPRQLIGDGRKHVEESVRDEHVVVRVHE